MSAQFTIRRNGRLQYYFQLCTSAGEAIFSSDTFYLKTSCESGIDAVRRCAGRNTCVGIRYEESGEAYFVVYGEAGDLLGRSIDFRNTVALEQGLASFRRAVGDAPVLELTA